MSLPKTRKKHSSAATGAPVKREPYPSKCARAAVTSHGLQMPDGSISVVREDAAVPAGAVNLLQPVWRNGKLLRQWTFDEVRENARLTPSAMKAAA